MNPKLGRRFANTAAVALAIGALSLFPARGSCDEVHFVHANGSTEPIDARCVETDKCDAKWLTCAYSPYSGRKLRVAIARSEPTAVVTDVPVSSVEDLLIQALLQTNRVTVVERTDDKGRLDYIIGVSVSNAGTEHRDAGGLAGRVIGGGLGLGGLGVNRNKTKLAVTFRLIDAKSEEVVSAQTVEGSSTVSTVNLGALGLGGGGGAAAATSGWKSPSLAAAAHVCADKVAYLVSQVASRTD